MSASEPGPSDDLATLNRDRRPPPAVIVIYAIYALGIVAGAVLAKARHTPEANPYLLFLIIWTITGITHAIVRNFERACAIGIAGSTMAYVILVLLAFEANEMFGAGVIMVALWAAVTSVVMGVPLLLVRTRREAKSAGRSDQGAGPG